MNGTRAQFEVPGPGAYLLAHSVGCLPVAARDAVDAALLAPWAESGADGWPAWLDAVESFRAAVAGLLGTQPALVCPQPGVSAALFALLGGLCPTPERNVLLASRFSFPSIGFAMRQCERLGYRLRLIDGDPADALTWRDTIDERTAAVVAMHVHSNSGLVAPVTDIAALARDADAVSIVDIAQSAGVLPIDISGWGVDAVVGSCVKWLCGGPGAGFLWASPTLIERSEPLNVGWFSHADPFGFDIEDFRYAPDARRFWGGTPSVAPYVIATAGIRTIASLGVADIHAHNRALIAAFADAASVDLDLRRRGGTLCLTAADADAFAMALTAEGIRFDRRAEVVRLSFHIWNDEREAVQAGGVARRFAIALA